MSAVKVSKPINPLIQDDARDTLSACQNVASLLMRITGEFQIVPRDPESEGLQWVFGMLVDALKFEYERADAMVRS